MRCANCKVGLGSGEVLYLLNIPLCWHCYGVVIEEVLKKKDAALRLIAVALKD